MNFEMSNDTMIYFILIILLIFLLAIRINQVEDKVEDKLWELKEQIMKIEKNKERGKNFESEKNNKIN